ncbi:hypothetical protein BDN72DRAFT_144436 [Pluteus cervinus]|uniref:Uncharacterized protein n=1 Tax=Pluteus cervinus TaxID=181527 RepID=A0ACD3AKX1_9AGAR|nr:hypothetical protein BDN72DRAFT_144436 [Pluteus cervinus]
MTDNSFPAELLDLVLSEYRPVYDAKKIEVISTRKTKVPKNWAPYASRLQFFSQLRLVCKSWYHFITPLLYSTFTLPTRPYEDLERVSKGLNYYPKLIDRLVIRGHIGDGTEQHAAELLAACLSRCTNIHTLEILDPHRIFRSSSKSKCLAIFRALPSTTPLRSLIIHFPHCNTQYTYPISTILLGLSPFIHDLKTLEIHEPSSGWIPAELRLLVLPSAFPNLDKLVVDTRGLRGGDLLKLISRISSKDTTVPITSNAPANSAKRECIIPLRHLTLSWDKTNQGTILICDLLKTNNLGQHLTTLWIDSNPIQFGQQESLPAFPAKIIAACPHLETFIYYVQSVETIFASLPRTLRVLGLSLPRDWGYPWLRKLHVNPLTSTNPKPLVDWLTTTRGNGIRKLLIQRTQLHPVIRDGVKRACKAANVEFAFD